MRTKATLQLDDGEVLRVEVERDDLSRDEIVVHRTTEDGTRLGGDLLATLDRILKDAKPHPAGTTDRLLQADRERPY